MLNSWSYFECRGREGAHKSLRWIKIKMQSLEIIYSIFTLNSLVRDGFVVLSTIRSHMNQPCVAKTKEKKTSIVRP